MHWLGAAVLFVLSAPAGFLHGQTQRSSSNGATGNSVRRFEIGGQFTDLTLGEPGQIDLPKFALGPGVAFNLNRHLALDSSYSVMNPPPCFSTACSGGRESFFVGGARVEARAKQYGLFAYGRPGIFHASPFTETSSLTSPTGPTTVTFSSPGSSRFVSDVGGGVEYFAPSRVRARVELGDLLEYYRCPACTIKNWTNHLQFSTGVYAMIGKPISGRSFDAYDGERSHRFLDKWNVLLLGASLLGQSADAITTQRDRSHGAIEADPLVKPFVDRGWPGQIGAGVIENGAQIFFMYRLHKTGHHRIERLVPLASGFIGGNQGYRNLQNR